MVKNPPANANSKDSGLTEQGFPGGSEGTESVCNARDPGLILGSGRCLKTGILGKLVQYSYLENSMDRGAWWAIAHRVIKSQTRLKRLSTHSADSSVDSFKMFLLAVMWEMGEGDRKGLHPMEEGLQQREEGRKNVSDSGYI